MSADADSALTAGTGSVAAGGCDRSEVPDTLGVACETPAVPDTGGAASETSHVSRSSVGDCKSCRLVCAGGSGCCGRSSDWLSLKAATSCRSIQPRAENTLADTLRRCSAASGTSHAANVLRTLPSCSEQRRSDQHTAVFAQRAADLHSALPVCQLQFSLPNKPPRIQEPPEGRNGGT